MGIRVSCMNTLWAVAIALGCGQSLAAQSVYTANTLQLDESGSGPKASIEDLAWFAGTWIGEAFGGRGEESWSAPSGGTMVGTFKLMIDGQVTLYELLLLVPENESVTMKVKHFSADFAAWEEKEGYLSFPLVKLEPQAVYFSGLTWRRVDEQTVEVFLALRRDGELTETKMLLRRQ